MKNYILIQLSVIILLILSSCYNQEELELDNPAGISLGNYFKNGQEAFQATIGMYSSLHAQQLWMQFGIIHESLADDVVCGDGNAENIAIDLFNLSTTNNFLNCWWEGSYNGVARVNNALDGINKVPATSIDETLRTNLQGEAKFLRGFYYLILVSLYGDVPLYTSPIDVNNPEQLFPVRTPLKDVYAQIFVDLEEAKESLPDKWDAHFLGRATKWTATAYLGKAYLYYACQLKNFENNPGQALEYYEKALNEFNEVIDLGPYQLDPDYLNNFTDEGDNNIESIWEVQYSKNVGQGTWGEGGQGSTRPWLIGTAANGGWKNVIPNKYALRKLQEYQPDDTIRILSNIWGAPGSMYDESTTYKAKLGIPDHQEVPPSNWGLRKYQYIPEDGNLYGNWVGNNMNFKLMRYADVLLMYAEAVNEVSGPVQAAYSAVEEVRSRVGLEGFPAGLSKADFFDMLIKERQIEFMGENMRWWDIKRWKIGQEVYEALNQFNATPEGDGSVTNFNPNVHYWMPIPQNEMDLNKNLKQNPGY